MSEWKYQILARMQSIHNSFKFDWEYRLVNMLCKIAMLFLIRLNIEIPCDPKVPFIIKIIERKHSNKYICTIFYCSTNHHSQKMETTQIFISASGKIVWGSIVYAYTSEYHWPWEIMQYWHMIQHRWTLKCGHWTPKAILFWRQIQIETYTADIDCSLPRHTGIKNNNLIK
jgi:hypothetical protein